MNIFVLDELPRLAAQYHCDKHVVKMILETAQMLSTCHAMTGTKEEILYRPAYINHSCNIWLRQSLSNYHWTLKLGMYLLQEYTYRFGRVHRSTDVIEWCAKNNPHIKDNGLTTRPLCMPKEYHKSTAVESYRMYYLNEKKHLLKWTKRQEPTWIQR